MCVCVCVCGCAVLVVVASIDRSTIDVALLVHTLTGWLPHNITAPLTVDTWDLVTSITPFNAPSPGEIQAAYLIACETTRVRERRRLVCVRATVSRLVVSKQRESVAHTATHRPAIR